LAESKPKDGEFRKYVRVESIDKTLAGKEVWVRGRVERSRKAGGSLVFMILRQRYSSIQVLLDETKGSDVRPRVMINWASKIKP